VLFFFSLACCSEISCEISPIFQLSSRPPMWAGTKCRLIYCFFLFFTASIFFSPRAGTGNGCFPLILDFPLVLAIFDAFI